MKLKFAEKEIDIIDYNDVMSFTGGQPRRVTATLKDSTKTVDEIKTEFEDAWTGSFSIEHSEITEAWEGYTISDISKQVDDISERLSITFTC